MSAGGGGHCWSRESGVWYRLHGNLKTEAGQRRSPKYAELASQHGPESMTNDVSIPITSQVAPSNVTRAPQFKCGEFVNFITIYTQPRNISNFHFVAETNYSVFVLLVLIVTALCCVH